MMDAVTAALDCLRAALDFPRSSKTEPSAAQSTTTLDWSVLQTDHMAIMAQLLQHISKSIPVSGPSARMLQLASSTAAAVRVMLICVSKAEVPIRVQVDLLTPLTVLLETAKPTVNDKRTQAEVDNKKADSMSQLHSEDKHDDGAVAAAGNDDEDKDADPQIISFYYAYMRGSVCGALSALLRVLPSSADRLLQPAMVSALVATLWDLLGFRDGSTIVQYAQFVCKLFECMIHRPPAAGGDSAQSSAAEVVISTRDQLGDSGAVEAVLGLLQEHRADGKVANAACDALSALTAAQHRSNQTRACTAGAVECLLGCLQSHITDSNMLQSVCQAMSSLTIGHSESQQRLIAAGGVEALINCAQRHADCDVLVDVLKRVLRQLDLPADYPGMELFADKE